MIQEDTVNLFFIENICMALIGIDKAHVLAAEILKIAVNEIGDNRIGELWHASQLRWSKLAPKDFDHQSFVKSHGLHYTLGGTTNVPKLAAEKINAEKVVIELERMFKDQAKTEDVLKWLLANVEESQRKNASFARTLSTALIKAAIIHEGKEYSVNKHVFTTQKPFLGKFIIPGSSAVEIEVLYAAQSIVNKLEHPQELLSKIFYELCDSDIISEDAFTEWRDDDNHKEPGKGVAVQSTKGFFEWIQSCEPEQC